MMEIDIPDLDDVRFEQSCGHCYWGWQREYQHKILEPTETELYRGLAIPTNNVIICSTCKGTGKVPTSVGERLIEFLRSRGVVVRDLGPVLEKPIKLY